MTVTLVEAPEEVDDDCVIGDGSPRLRRVCHALYLVAVLGNIEAPLDED